MTRRRWWQRRPRPHPAEVVDYAPLDGATVALTLAAECEALAAELEQHGRSTDHEVGRAFFAGGQSAARELAHAIRADDWLDRLRATAAHAGD
jgi:hypothetical protein